MPNTAGADGQNRGAREHGRGGVGVLIDAARTLAAGSALVFAGWISALPKVLAFQVEGGAAVSEGGIIEFALRQGGALAVLLVVLWFYRRDYKSLADFWKQSDGEKSRLIEELTRAQTEQSGAMREMSQAMRDNTSVVQAAKSLLAERGRLR